jgi:hypothetical protein
MGAYLLYVPMDATWKTDSKTSKIGTFIPAASLKAFRLDGIDCGPFSGR